MSLAMRLGHGEGRTAGYVAASFAAGRSYTLAFRGSGAAAPDGAATSCLDMRSAGA